MANTLKCIINHGRFWELVFTDLLVKNPGYMKENFIICIESMHIADTGSKDNVSKVVVVKIYWKRLASFF